MLFSLQSFLATVSNQPLRLTNLAHDRIASVDALSAVNALHLESVSNIDTGWTDRGTVSTIDAITINGTYRLAFVPWLTPVDIVRHNQAFAI